MAKRNISNIFNPIRRRKATVQGSAGYDNVRDNIDPHIKTKVVSSQEGTITKVAINDNDIVNKKYIDDNIVSSQWITSGSDIYYDSGNIGIGIDLPEQKIHVLGDGAQYSEVRVLLDNDAQDGKVGYNMRNDAQHWQFFLNGADGDKFTIRDITGNTYPFKIGKSVPTNTLSMNTTGIGIKKLTATEALDVTGNILASGNVQGVTQAEFNTLTDNSMADTLHRHSELSASDGTPDQVFTVDTSGDCSATGEIAATDGFLHTGDRAIVGDSTSKLIQKMGALYIFDGTNANTIAAQFLNIWNANAITYTDNIGKNQTVGDFYLNAAGTSLFVVSGLGGTTISNFGVLIFNSTGTSYMGNVYLAGGYAVFQIQTMNTGTAVDLTTIPATKLLVFNSYHIQTS